MSTTKDSEELKWKKWGENTGKTPAFKEYIELLIKFNNQQREILKDTKDWLLQGQAEK